jgi:hypothetical protein
LVLRKNRKDDVDGSSPDFIVTAVLKP